MGTLPPLSLYVHLPWCVRKCPYCDFNSYERSGQVPERSYVDALLRDLSFEARFAAGRALESIFVGGGTPSLFSPAAIARLLEGIADRLRLASGIEVTLEANPGAIEAARFGEFRSAGINRLSIGVQSFRDEQLAVLGRIHDGNDARRAAEAASSAGFESVNLDLMYGLPNDTPAGALADLEAAIALEPAHLSWYQLTLEPSTAFYRRPPPLPDDTTIAAIEAEGRALLDRSGLRRYEISAYARAGHRCRHNLNYWRFGDYLGVGAGAHGKLTDADGTIVRRAKQRNPRTYAAHAGTPSAFTEERIAAPRQLVLEFMMNALRLPDGVDVATYEARTGQGLGLIEKPLEAAVARGWLSLHDGTLEPTATGLEMLNAMLGLFVDFGETPQV